VYFIIHFINLEILNFLVSQKSEFIMEVIDRTRSDVRVCSSYAIFVLIVLLVGTVSLKHNISLS